MHRETSTSALLLPIALSLLLGTSIAVGIFLVWNSTRSEKQTQESFFAIPSEDLERSTPAGEETQEFSIEELRRDPEVLATNLRRTFHDALLPDYLEAQSYEFDALGMEVGGKAEGVTARTPPGPERR